MSLLRIIIALLLLVGLMWYVGFGELFTVLSDLRPTYVVLLILLAPVLIWASCVKWQLFVHAAGHQAPILELMRFYTIGYFFSFFTPSHVGGDVVRSFHLGKRLGNQKDAFIATFLERFTGLLAISVLGASFVMFGTPATEGLEIAILIVFAGALCLAFICFSEPVASPLFSLGRKIISAVFGGGRLEKLLRILNKVEDGMSYARGNPVLVFKALLLSLVFHSLTVVNTYLAARSIGWEDPSVSGLFVAVPLVLLISIAPITPSGLGIQEGAFLFFLARIGATSSQGLGVGVVLRAKGFLLAASGALLWSLMKKLPEPPRELASDAAKSDSELPSEVEAAETAESLASSEDGEVAAVANKSPRSLD